MKSAVLARASGAARVLGFSIWHLREKGARPFYSQTVAAESTHVVHKNLRLLEGEAAPGVSSGEAMAEMERLADNALDRAHTRFIVSDDPQEIVVIDASGPEGLDGRGAGLVRHAPAPLVTASCFLVPGALPCRGRSPRRARSPSAGFSP